jgi:hypothetical protein
VGWRGSSGLTILERGVLFAFLAMAGYALFTADVPRRDASPEQRAMEEARKINAAIPFAGGPLMPAPRYVFRGTPAAKLQATECLATAALYEAGDDERGQKAVIQVILNRVRHPGYPKTICGVVYQGSKRPTGCQFSFTCDGSMQRRRIRDGWTSARKAARLALDGYVFAAVGTATHYHTDWVAPYWSGSLDKLAQVHSHIFYR